MKIDISIIADVSLEEAKKIISVLQKLGDEINLTIKNAEKHLDLVLATKSNTRHKFFDLPSKFEPMGVSKEGYSLASWYRDEMYLSVRVCNTLARENIWPRELVGMKDQELLALRQLGETSLWEIKRGLEWYFTLSI